MDEQKEKTEEKENIEEKVEVVNEVKQETSDENNSKALSIASLVLGIVSVVCLSSGLICIVCGVLAIIFGLQGQKRAGKGMAKAGFILGIIALSIYAVVAVLGIALGVGILSAIFAIL